MIAAAAFRDVVEQRRDVEQPGLVPAGGQLRAERVFVRVLGHEKAPHVAQHHQDVLVHRVDVEQVVLHLAHDAAEHPQVAPQHAGLVHQPEGVGDALRLLQDGQESLSVDRVVAEVAVHHRPRVVQRAQRAGRQALQARRLRIQQKGFENGPRLLLEQLVVHHFQQAVAVDEALVDRALLGRRLALRGAQVLLDVLQQDLVELRDGLGRPVVAAHQHFAGAQHHAAVVGTLVLKAEGFGHSVLQVEHQPVLAPAGDQVQARAHHRQQRLVVAQLAQLARRHQAGTVQILPVAADAGRARRPQNDLQVAQPAGRFLAVGLERVGRVLVLQVALALLQPLGDEEIQRIERGHEALLERLEQLAVAHHQARLKQRGLHRQVGRGHGQAFIHRAHAGADLQPRVPALADEGFDAPAQRGVVRRLAVGGQQQQHVDVGMRKQLAAAVAAHGDQGRARIEPVVLPQRAQRLVGQLGQVRQRAADAARAGAAAAQLVQQGLLGLAVRHAHGGHLQGGCGRFGTHDSGLRRRRAPCP